MTATESSRDSLRGKVSHPLTKSRVGLVRRPHRV